MCVRRGGGGLLQGSVQRGAHEQRSRAGCGQARKACRGLTAICGMMECDCCLSMLHSQLGVRMCTHAAVTASAAALRLSPAPLTHALAPQARLQLGPLCRHAPAGGVHAAVSAAGYMGSTSQGRKDGRGGCALPYPARLWRRCTRRRWMAGQRAVPFHAWYLIGRVRGTCWPATRLPWLGCVRRIAPCCLLGSSHCSIGALAARVAHAWCID